jgi:hypothetical protein
MLGVALRVGPRRGFWNQPAAMLRRPGGRVFVGLYAFAIVHVLLGVGVVLLVPGGEVGVLVVLVGAALFYVLCAHSWVIAHRLPRRRAR